MDKRVAITLVALALLALPVIKGWLGIPVG